jgi:mannosyltransferase
MTRGEESGRDRLDRLSWWAPPALTLALGLLFSWQPSFWLDEASTISAAQRPVPDILRLTDTIDRVHALYYLLLHPWLSLTGVHEFTVRLPSAVAMAVAAAGVVAIGRRLGSRGFGLRAGFAFALLPLVSHHAMDARPFPFALAAVTWSTWALIRGLQNLISGRGAIRWWLAWALLGGLAVLFSLYTIFILVAHALTVAWARQGRRALGFAVVGAGLAIALTPWALAIYAQRFQIATQADRFPASILKIPLWSVAGWIYYPKLLWAAVAAVLAVALWGCAAYGLRSSWTRRGQARVSVASVALPWFVMPAILIIAVSAISTPSLQARYLLGTAPALALLVALGWQHLPHRPVVALATVSAGVATLALQVVDRTQASREDLRGLADVVATHRQAGDAVLFAPGHRVRVTAAYPGPWAGLSDIGHRGTAAESRSLAPAEIPYEQMRVSAQRFSRVWVVAFAEGAVSAETMVTAQASALGLQADQTWVNRDWVLMLAHPQPSAP